MSDIPWRVGDMSPAGVPIFVTTKAGFDEVVALVPVERRTEDEAHSLAELIVRALSGLAEKNRRLTPPAHQPRE